MSLLLGFSLFHTKEVFLAFIKMIADITIALLNIAWLAIWIWALIGPFEFNINRC